MSIIRNIDTNQKQIRNKSETKMFNNTHCPPLKAFIFHEELIIIITTIAIIFAIMFCCIKADMENTYTKQLRRISYHCCECQKCGKNDSKTR